LHLETTQPPAGRHGTRPVSGAPLGGGAGRERQPLLTGGGWQRVRDLVSFLSFQHRRSLMMEKARILLADDEPTFAEATADLLRREGYDVETAPDGASAIARVRAAPFDLLISDLEMPGNSDLELVKQVAEQSGGLPIIILTGYPSVRSAVACIELPVSAYLVKPVAFEELYSRVTAAVRRFRTYQAMRNTEERLEQW